MVYDLGFMIGNTKCTLVNLQPINTPARREEKYYEHCHPCFEFHYVEEGEATFICDKAEVTLSKDQLLIIPPRTYHKEISDGENMKLSISVDITPCLKLPADNHFYSVFYRNRVMTVSVCDTLKNEILKLKKLCTEDDGSHIMRERIRAGIHIVTAELYDVLSHGSPKEREGLKDSTLSREYEIDTFLALNFTSNSARDDLAKKLHVSTRQLHRIMIKSYGKSYREKLLELRLEIAQSFLTSTAKSITEISEEMGYENLESFSAFIKKATGKSPMQIRKEKGR